MLESGNERPRNVTGRHLPPAVRGRRRRLGQARQHRPRNRPQSHRIRIPGAGLPGQSPPARAAQPQSLSLGGGDPRPGRSRRHRRAQGAGPRRRGGLRPEGRQGPGGDHRRVQGGRRGRRRARKDAPGADHPLRNADGRSQLHGDSQHRADLPARRQLRPDAPGPRAYRLHVAERRAGRGDPLHRRPQGDRILDVRLGRQQDRRVGQRPAPLLGKRPGHRGHPALPGELRRPASLHGDRPAHHAPEADPGRQGRPDLGRRPGRLLAHRRAGRTGHGHRPPVRTVRRDAGGFGRGALRSGAGLLAPAGAGRAADRHHHQRRRAGNPGHRRLRGARAGRRAAVPGHPGTAPGRALPRRQPGESDRPAGQRHARRCTGPPFGPASRIRTSTD